MKLKSSFSARLSLNILLMASVMLLLSLGIATYWSITLISKEAIKSAQNLLDKNIADIEKTLSSMEISVRNNAWIVREHLDDPEFLYHITSRVVGENPNIVGSAIAFIPGYYKGQHFFSPYSYRDAATEKIYSKQLGNDDYDYFSMEWFSVPFETGKPFWGEPYYDKGGGEQLMCTYSLPLMDKNGEVFAVMTADISLEWISKVQSGIKPYKNSNVVLLSSIGTILTSESAVGKLGENIYSNFLNYPDDSKNVDKLLDAILNKERGMMKYEFKNDHSFVVYAPLSNSWVATVSCTYPDILAGVTKMILVIFQICILGIVLLSFLSYKIINTLTRPLSDFANSAKEISKGNFDTPLPVIKTRDEIGLLRDSFSDMQYSLRTYIEELKTSTAENERFESELDIASKIQVSMLPHDFPSSEYFDLFACQKSSKEVGGDLYDFNVKDNYLYFAIGDVSGKGVPASLVMAATKAAFRFVTSLDIKIDEMVNKINNFISENNERGMFVTFFLGRLNYETGLVEFCNAGHNPPIVTRKDGTVRNLKVVSNLVLGVCVDYQFEAQQISLEKGDRLTLYTDGVSEAEKSDGSLFGEDRLRRLLAGTDTCSEEALCEHIMDGVYDFFEGRPQNDDITLLSLRIKK